MRRILLLTIVGWLAATAPAAAQATADVTPDAAGKGSRLHFGIDGTLPPVSGSVPSGLTLTAPAGMRWNPAAAPKRCTRLKASLNECPGKSRVGRASLVIHVQTPDQQWDVTIDLKLYLRTARRLLAVGYVAGGTRVVPGRVDTANGLVVVFDPLPAPPPFENVSYVFKSMTVDLGATRRVRRSKRRTVRVHLLRNPGECATAAWPASTTLTFPAAPAVVLDTPVSCKRP